MTQTYISRTENSDDIWIKRRGSRNRGIFFGILGFLFEIIFVYIWVSLRSSDPELLYLIFTLYNTEVTPFLFIFFVFGAGCFLITLREFGWEESILIKQNLVQNTPGIRKQFRFFSWIRAVDIPKERIIALRLHTIFMDQLGLNKSYHIEVDYQETTNSPVTTLVLFRDYKDTLTEPAASLVNKIHDILALPEEIEKTESKPV